MFAFCQTFRKSQSSCWVEDSKYSAGMQTRRKAFAAELDIWLHMISLTCTCGKLVEHILLRSLNVCRIAKYLIPRLAWLQARLICPNSACGNDLWPRNVYKQWMPNRYAVTVTWIWWCGELRKWNMIFGKSKVTQWISKDNSQRSPITRIISRVSQGSVSSPTFLSFQGISYKALMWSYGRGTEKENKKKLRGQIILNIAIIKIGAWYDNWQTTLNLHKTVFMR